MIFASGGISKMPIKIKMPNLSISLKNIGIVSLLNLSDKYPSACEPSSGGMGSRLKNPSMIFIITKFTKKAYKITKIPFCGTIPLFNKKQARMANKKL